MNNTEISTLTWIVSSVYGLNLVFIVYAVAYFSVRGVLHGGAIPVLVTLSKFAIYSAAIIFGFKVFPATGILIGFTGGLYLSLLGFCIWHLLKKEE